jgi:hypothetical protein
LVQLERHHYIHRDGDSWCVSQEGEALAATRNLKEVFPLEPTAIPPSNPASSGTVIHIGANSQIGILNTGQIHKIERNIITLRQSGAKEIAAAFKALAEAIGKSQELAPERAKEALELVEALSAEAAKPLKSERQPASSKAA